MECSLQKASTSFSGPLFPPSESWPSVIQQNVFLWLLKIHKVKSPTVSLAYFVPQLMWMRQSRKVIETLWFSNNRWNIPLELCLSVEWNILIFRCISMWNGTSHVKAYLSVEWNTPPSRWFLFLSIAIWQCSVNQQTLLKQTSNQLCGKRCKSCSRAPNVNLFLLTCT